MYSYIMHMSFRGMDTEEEARMKDKIEKRRDKKKTVSSQRTHAETAQEAQEREQKKKVCG